MGIVLEKNTLRMAAVRKDRSFRDDVARGSNDREQ
jgi:hypothetical protein